MEEKFKKRDKVKHKHRDQAMIVSNYIRPERTAKCFCGSQKKFRHCHREAFDKLKMIGDNNLKVHGYMIGKAAGLFSTININLFGVD